MRIALVALLILVAWALLVLALRTALPVEVVRNGGQVVYVRAWWPYVEHDPSGVTSYCLSSAGGRVLPPFLTGP